MKREDVYHIIDGEREYQDTIRRMNEKETRNDNEKSVADFLLYIEYTLNKAKDSIYHLNEEDAKECVRKIAGLSVACMETHETQPRLEKF